MTTKSWKNIKDSVYGKIGTARRDKLDRKFEYFKAGLPMNENEFNNFIKEGEKAYLLHQVNSKRNSILGELI